MTIIDKNFSDKFSRNIDDYAEGIVINVYKPYRWTSADVIRKVKYSAIRHFGKKNLKVGHAGTLDPLAEGVLLVCIGNACKQAQALQDSGKEYIAGVCIGATTPSYDLEKDVDRMYSLDGVSREAVEAVLPSFLGEQDQVAPLFSAKQVDGVRAYELARKLYREGGSLDEAASELLRVGHINISEIELVGWGVSGSAQQDSDPAQGSGSTQQGTSSASSRINVAPLPESLPIASVRLACSKGTYVRAFARDLGEKLGSGAFLSSLERSKSGNFSSRESITLERLISLFSLQ